MARWEKFGSSEILTSTVRYLDHEDEQECELEMVLLEDARRALAEESARIREALLDKGIDFLVDEIGADSLRGEKWQRFVDRICPKEP